ncbi:uncharacterized protein LOC122258916 [Penaeus japonicus]|uniref:uncharacterized protein LOC122258916 n=1 Tax=Penaeus japonicus TaxID=27405 RepID=UPI001C712279|nr:uncharacterized protein LOC122258916 [Penaeus japonicus]
MALVVLTRPPSKSQYAAKKKQEQEQAREKEKAKAMKAEQQQQEKEETTATVGSALMEVTLKMLTLGPRSHPAFTGSPARHKKVRVQIAEPPMLSVSRNLWIPACDWLLGITEAVIDQ